MAAATLIEAARETEGEIVEIIANLEETLRALRARPRPRFGPDSDHDAAHLPGRVVILPFRETAPQYIGDGG